MVYFPHPLLLLSGLPLHPVHVRAKGANAVHPGEEGTPPGLKSVPPARGFSGDYKSLLPARGIFSITLPLVLALTLVRLAMRRQ